MTPEQWEAIQDKLHAALNMKAAERAEFLAGVGVSDPEVHHELESLIAAHEQANAEFLKGLDTVAHLPHALISGIFVGRRLGNYQILEQLGTGGMGEVYSAIRADDQYQKQVAIKLVRAGPDSGFVISRFKNERQILAGLDHPNIARLLDGGTTEEGVPYFVMELIEGEPIDRYSDNHRLTTTERLQLFSQVCSAVQYAHQRLIIHRDIKPSNILVTADGTPKLLDFGIAKIVEVEAATDGYQPTLTAFRALTPGYASPEQIKGEPITTASDVYSLGVVLYELLTGHRPYRVSKWTPQEITRAVCETEPEKPSIVVSRTESGDSDSNQAAITPASVSAVRDGSAEKLRKRLGGDLDNIVLMALRKEPQRRYASVEQFREDIRRHLEHLPVIARKDTVAYRTTKFVARHKAGVLAAAIVAITLFAGMVITVREARIARSERVRAERRFNDVRKLANSLFDIDSTLGDLGVIAGRKMIVGVSLNYLDSLAHEASGDVSLQRELSDAYISVGDIQGRFGTENLGDIPGAMASYGKAAEITHTLLKASPEPEKDQYRLGILYRKMGNTLEFTADSAGALKYDNMALATLAKLAEKDPANAKYQVAISNVYVNLGSEQDFTGDFQASLDSYSKAAATYSRFSDSADKRLAYLCQYNLGQTYQRLAITWNDLRNYSKALEYGEKSLQITKMVLAINTKRALVSARVQLDVAVSYAILGESLQRKGDLDRALAAHLQAQSIAELVTARDANDQRGKETLVEALYGLGETYRRKGDLAKAIDLGQRAVRLGNELAAGPLNANDKVWLVKAYTLLGDAYASRSRDPQRERQYHLTDLMQARSSYQKALDVYNALNQSGGLPFADASEFRRLPGNIANCVSALHKLGHD